MNPRSLRPYDVVNFKYKGVQKTKITVRNIAIWNDWFGSDEGTYFDKYVTDLEKYPFPEHTWHDCEPGDKFVIRGDMDSPVYCRLKTNEPDDNTPYIVAFNTETFDVVFDVDLGFQEIEFV